LIRAGTTQTESKCPTIQSLGKDMKAYTHATYTVPAPYSLLYRSFTACLITTWANIIQSLLAIMAHQTGKAETEKRALYLVNNHLEGFRLLGFIF
jgi:hypothetical protein